MPTESDKLYTRLRIESDLTDGLVTLSLVERLGDQRKTKVKNNFTGLLEPADSAVVTKLANILAGQIGDVNETVVVGMYKSGIVTAAYLGLARRTRFAWTTPDSLDEACLVFNEPHRANSQHFLYGLSIDDRVILVEDEITSGHGIVGLTKVLNEVGIRVVAITSFIETLNFGGRAYIKQETGLDLISLTKIRLDR